MEGIVMFSASLALWEYRRASTAAKKFEEAYWGERRGRTRVEKEMRRISDIQLNLTQGIFVQPIGIIHSCYRQCVGTPRQGLLVPASRSTLILDTNISPDALDGLEEFSHVWITFKFHLNTNTLKESKSFAPQVAADGTAKRQRSTFKAKITLPMLKQKKGVFATRSPHRPNPTGVTLAQISRIDAAKRTVYLTACDLVEGTPVLDIKPYVPAYDSVNHPGFVGPDGPVEERIASWIESTVLTRNEVTIEESCKAEVKRLQNALEQYKNEPEEFIKGLVETLQAEVRSKFQTDRRMQDTSSGVFVEVPFDNLMVRYQWLEERRFHILSVVLRKDSQIAKEEEELMLGEGIEDGDDEEGEEDDEAK